MVSVKLYGLPLTCCVVVQANNLQMIVRAHECVMDGFERFAQGHLITLFSATNYCGTANNAGGSFVSFAVGVLCHLPGEICVIHCGSYVSSTVGVWSACAYASPCLMLINALWCRLSQLLNVQAFAL